MPRPRVRDAQVHPSVRATLDQIAARSEKDHAYYIEHDRDLSSVDQSKRLRSRSRSRGRSRDHDTRRARTSTKKSSMLPTHHRSGRKRSRSSHRKNSPNRLKRTRASPSGVWRLMPVKFRIIVFLIGFMFVYYGVFGKHHYFDREMSSIQNDVENLLRQANQSGFMQRKFEEAVLPPIFRDGGTTTSSDENPKENTAAKTSVTPEKKPHEETKEKSGKSDRSKEPKSKKKKGEKRKQQGKGKGKVDIKKEKVDAEKKSGNKTEKDKLESSTKIDSEDANSKTSSTEGKDHADASSDSSDSSNKNRIKKEETVGDGGNSMSAALKTLDGNGVLSVNTSESNVSTTSFPINSTISGAEDVSTSLTGESSTAAARPNSTTTGERDTGRVSEMSLTAETNVSSGVAENGSKNGTSDVSTTEVGLEESNGNSKDFKQQSANETGVTSAPPKDLLEEETRDYTQEFHDLTTNEVPKDHLPVLTWNYKAVLDPNIPEQIFGLGDKLDHVAVYKPLCINTADETAFMFEGKPVCGGFNRTEGWLIQYCSVMRESLHKEYLLQVQREAKPRSWLVENKAKIRWVEGLTVLQVLEKNCGNIAHFSGRILLLQHIIDNIAAYAAPPSRIMNVLVLPTFHIMKRFLYPHNYEFWHKTLLAALVAPSNFTIGTLGNFLYRDLKPRMDGLAMVQLLHNFSMQGSGDEDKEKQYVCFRRAVVPGYLKARFFVNDMEYPSTKPSLQSTAKDAPQVPRDSLRMRERVSALVEQSVKFAGRKKEIVLLDRNGSRRVFSPESRVNVLAMLKKVADEKGYNFKVVGFDKMTFQQQYDVMKSVSVAIGIHGANLVNTMFMPPLAVLFEVFPYGFHHEMYVNGGNAGLKYFSYRMKEGVLFEGPKVYRSVEQCIKLNQKCKVHYRDAVLQVGSEDLAEMERLLREAVDWCDALPSTDEDNVSSTDSENGNQRRRLRRRRRLLNRQRWGWR